MKNAKPIREQVPIPLGLTRHWLLAIACVLCVINGPIVLNWPPLRSLLVDSRVYAWRCTELDDFDSDGTCAEQRKDIALLGNLGQTFMFVGSLLAGYTADTFGPKVAGCLGGLLFALQHLFTAVSTQSFQLYIPAYILAGLAIEMSFFSLISIANLYPRNQAFALSILGTFRSIAMAYALFQNAITIPGTFGIQAMSAVCASIAVLTSVLSFFILPNENFRLIREKPALEDNADLEQVDTVQVVDEAREDGEPQRPESIVPFNQTQESNGTLMKQALRLVVRPVYLVWLLYFSLAYCRGVFYALSLQDQHPDVVDAYSILSPLSFIPCPFLGLLADSVGMLWVLALLNTTGTVMYICLASGTSLAAQWIAVLASSILMSFLASQNYCYIAGAYTEKMQGKLAGFAMLVAGLLNFVNTPLYNWATDSDQFQSVNYVYLGVSGLLYILLAFLTWKRHSTERGKERAAEKAALLAGPAGAEAVNA